MQHLNDDMDKLVRKAAEQYPLNTKGADWEKVFRDMNAQPAEPEEIKQPGGGKSYRHLLWLLLLLPLLWVASRYFNGSSKNNTTQTTDVKAKNGQQSAENKPGLDSGANVNNQKAKDEVSSAGQAKEASKEKTEENGNASGNEVKEKNVVADNNQQQEKTVKQKNVAAKNVLSDKNKPSINKADIQPGDKMVKNDNKSTQNAVTQPPQDKSKLPTTDDKKNPAPANPVVTPNATVNKNDVKAKSNDSSTSSANTNKQAQPPSVKNDDKKADIIHLKPTPQKQFYVGLLTGPDLTTVKLETMNAGYGVGAILGYRFNDHWGVETGLFWSNKNYYADGKDFSTKKLAGLPSHTNILNVDGNCYMYEIPLNVNYYFGRSSGYNWFVNLGASSYLMNKEYYDYLAERYNMQWAGSWSYKNASKDWFSVLNVGAGFDQRIGKSGKLRLQPYFRIPIRGTGTGKLPITSTGFYIGYTQKLF